MSAIKPVKIPKSSEKNYHAISDIIQRFCEKHLDKEYQMLCEKLLLKLARKRPSPLLSGRSNTWAAGIVHALGMVNFVFDKSQTPHVTSKEICHWFNLSSNTISQKSKSIRDIFKMCQLDPKWSLPSKLKNNPLAWMISFNGYIIDAREAPYELQLAAHEAGLIPYIPDEQED